MMEEAVAGREDEYPPRTPEQLVSEHITQRTKDIATWEDVEEVARSIPLIMDALRQVVEPLNKNNWQLKVLVQEEQSGTATQTKKSRGFRRRKFAEDSSILSQKDWIKLYKEDRAKCISLLLPNTSNRCTIPKSDVESHYKAIFSAPPALKYCELLRQTMGNLPDYSMVTKTAS
ncbi:hypothetical protein L596_025963 [Steinernema carpocapsae]|uniref:Uncharacterized protein n=1 Tax=Steinernema carpocapsae TaxID=34508 RepID=A0A4U5M9B5_STECR|nr:hypothetical protein L596_025963 [Steinernema carpocapsae]